MKKQDGFSAAEGLLIIIVVTIIGFGGWHVRSRQDDSENDSSVDSISSYEDCVAAGYPIAESLPPQCSVPGGPGFIQGAEDKSQDSKNSESTNESDPDGWVSYANEEFGFSLDYPEQQGKDQVSENDYTDNVNESAGGKHISIDVDSETDIWITAETSDFFVSKGSSAASNFLPRGYSLKDGQYVAGGNFTPLDTTPFEGLSSGIYVEETSDGIPDYTLYTYAFNTKVGGLAITTSNPDKLELLREIALTVEID